MPNNAPHNALQNAVNRAISEGSPVFVEMPAEPAGLTKNDIHAIRRADAICVHLSPRNPAGLVRLIKRKGYDAKPFETDQEYVLEGVTVTFETSHGRRALEAGTADCFAMTSIYHNQHTPASGILRSLREGDSLTFSFYPDCHTNGYVAEAGLHADCLYLHVKRGEKHARQTWELESSIAPANSARMCRGVPKSDSYESDAARVRNLA